MCFVNKRKIIKKKCLKYFQDKWKRVKDHNCEIVIIRKPWNTTKKSMEFCAASPTSAPKCMLESGLKDTVSTSA